MLEIADTDLKTYPLDHHGLIAAVCKDLRIAERIDQLLPVHDARVVSPGRAVVALILNGLGFTNRRLYLTPQFFASKPVERLLDAPISAQDLNDHTFGHALDDLSGYGVSRLFGTVAFGIAIEKKTAWPFGAPRHHQHQRLGRVRAAAREKYARKGKPAAGDEPALVGYTLDLVLERNEEVVRTLLNKKGRFILATNDMDAENYPAARMLAEYKAQQGVERGFRFLKDPWFMVDLVFLKSSRRIEALMMVMTLCLLVYNVAQYRLRDKLKTTGETLPNQLDKEVQNPTLQWIFQIMEGLGIARFETGPGRDRSGPVRELVTNMSSLRKKTIRLFGPTACRMHGPNPESAL